VPRLVYVSCMTLVFVIYTQCLDSCMCHLYIYMIWTCHEIVPRLIYVSFIHVYALTHLCLIYTHSFIRTYLCASVRGTWLIYMCCITHPSKCVTWLIHVCSVTHPCVWHNASARVIWLTEVCDVAHSCVWHESVNVCDMWEPWLIHTWDIALL